MADEKKQLYYQKNKGKRLAYQRAYYEVNKERIKRNRALKIEIDPQGAKIQRDYNREYYQKNKKRIKLARTQHTKFKLGKRETVN